MLIRLISTLYLTAALTAAVTAAEPPRLVDALPKPKMYLQVSPEGRADLHHLLGDLEAALLANEEQKNPVIVVLHGPEAAPFLRRNYRQNRLLVDRAARLEAFGRVELRMCETWLRDNGFDESDLLPFVEAVPRAPDEIRRLEQAGYRPYPSVTL